VTVTARDIAYNKSYYLMRIKAYSLLKIKLSSIQMRYWYKFLLRAAITEAAENSPQ
jgi:hypothetical protein